MTGCPQTIIPSTLSWHSVRIKSGKVLLSAYRFKTSVFQTEKKTQECAGGAHLRKGDFNRLLRTHRL